MILTFFKRNNKALNSKTPKWFKEWHAREFLPIKIRQNIMIVIGMGLFIALVVELAVH